MEPLGLVVIALGTATIVALAVAVVSVGRAGRRERLSSESARRAEQIKNEFVSMVSHELLTPLTSIAGFADTLLHSWRELAPEEIDEFLEIIDSQSRYLSELVEDVLVIPRLEAGRLRLDPTDLDLSALAHEVSNLLFPPGGPYEASVAIPGGVRVFADPRRVQQILRNLLENARKHGGEQVLVEGAQYRDHYLVVVSDNGPGVPKGDEERIFLHFEQGTMGDSRSNEGIGLGLPIARKLANAMGGDVWYEPRFPTGARFCFTIPVRGPEPGGPPPAASERAGRRVSRVP